MRSQALGQYVFVISKEESFKPKALVPIIFTNKDLEAVNLPYVDPLIIKLRIGKAVVSQVLVNGGSSSNIVF